MGFASSFVVAAVGIALINIACLEAHPTRYPRPLKDFDCAGKSGVPPTIISYHTHIIYMLTNNDQITAALALREKARNFFKDFLGPDCDGRYDNGRLCLIDDHPFNITLADGPFPVGEWSIFLPVPYYGLVVPWLSQNRGEFSLLIHPNTGCEYEDHSTWAFWSGPSWPLDMSIFTPQTQTNEFNVTAGTTLNPTCVAAGLACGNPIYDGAGLSCCEHSHCACEAARSCKCVAVSKSASAI